MTIHLDKIVTGPQVSLQEMLDARERRQDLQRSLIQEYHLPIISFTLNIVGPVKVFPLALKTFHEGVRLIKAQCHAWKIPILCTRTIEAHTGYESFWVVDTDVRFVKEILCLLEDSVEFGRLFDVDVIQPDGGKISRADLGFASRKCLICSNDAFVCSRSRTHSVRELLDRECQIMSSYFANQYAKKLSSLSMQALLYEVSVTPKPGLVDRNNTGAHQDMDIFTFEASAVSLNHYFEKFALCGIENCGEPFSRIFARLRSLGIQAEDAMFAATGNINTHKGLIFALAVLNCSLGYLYANGLAYFPELLKETNRKLVQDVLEDFKDVTPENAKTNGERLYAKYGIKGARGEALSGYSTVFDLALPKLKKYLDLGYSVNDAGAMTLLHIIAYSEDTNIVNRSSYADMKEIQRTLSTDLRHMERAQTDRAQGSPAPLSADPQSCLEYLRQLDREFIRRNISPGGSADLLALTYFIYLYENRI